MEKIIYDDDIRDVTRLHNRALRTVNRRLRRQAEQAKQETDEIVAALFDAPAPTGQAEIALRKIWDVAGIAHFCSPSDYEAIADHVIALLRDMD